MKPKAMLIFSGGMDSTVLFARLRREFDVDLVSFNYGSKHNQRELEAVERICKHYVHAPATVINLPFVNELFASDLLKAGQEIPEGHYEDESMRRTIVPFRNGIMLSIAAGLAESRKINLLYYGAHAGDQKIYPDCRPEFYESMARSLGLGTSNFQVSLLAPFLKVNKREIALDGWYELQAPLELTWSCYKGGRVHCGRCGACVERREALKGFDITPYEEGVKTE